jgi:uncharacterized membrane protein
MQAKYHGLSKFHNQNGQTMNFDPFLNSPVYIQLHAICALISLAIGPIALYRKNRDRTHKMVGYVWMTTMATTEISSFWIREINADGSLSPVHLFAVLTLGTLIYALWAIGRRDINAHRHALRNLYFGTVAAIAMNFIPNRTLPNVFIDGGSPTTFVSAAVIIALVIISVTIITRGRA